jgi:hypothetical protein
MRSFIVALAALVLLPAGLWAEEIRGQIKSVDAGANKVIIIVDGNDRTMTCVKDCPVSTMITQNRLLRRRSTVQEVFSNMKDLTPGTQVTLITETRDGADMVTQIRISSIQSGMQTTTSGYATRTRRGLFR